MARSTSQETTLRRIFLLATLLTTTCRISRAAQSTASYTVGYKSTPWIMPIQDGLEIQTAKHARLVTGIWTLIITIHEPTVPDEFIDLVSSTLNHLKNVPLRSYTTIWEQRLETLLLSIQHSHSWWRHSSGMRTRDMPKATTYRGKRGLFNIVGYGLKYLFGTVTEDEVKDIHQSLKNLANNQQKLYHDLVKFSSFINHTYDEIQTNRDAINDLKRQVIVIGMTLSTFTNQIQSLQFRARTELFISELERAGHLFLEQYSHWHQRKEHLELGRLSESLLPPDILLEILSASSHQSFEIIRPIEWYYEEVRLVPMWTDHLLVYKAVLPLVSQTVWNLVSITSWPTPSHHHFVSLQLPSSVLYDTGTNHVVLNSLCTGERPAVCYPGTQYSASSFPCLQSLLLQSPRYHDKCRIILSSQLHIPLPSMNSAPENHAAIQNKDTVLPYELNSYTLITNGTSLTHRCQGHAPVKFTVLPGVYRLQLKSPCAVAAQDWTIDATVVRTKNLTVKQQRFHYLPNITLLDYVHNYTSLDRRRFNITRLDNVKRQVFKLHELIDVPMYKDDAVPWWTYFIVSFILIMLACLLAYLINRTDRCPRFVLRIRDRRTNSNEAALPPVVLVADQPNTNLTSLCTNVENA